MSIGIKPLEWEPSAFDTQYGLIIQIAKTPFGPYKILKGTQNRYQVYFGNAPYSGSMDDEDQAKAWANSDYGTRVLSVLISSTDPKWRFEWPNGHAELRDSPTPKNFNDWAATVTPAMAPNPLSEAAGNE